ncbi:MAG: glycoside hydrolase family 65, partial [Defluviitaleaceae bacterium]|nr:glycoside hydrolase family 65 [Defluviitaleaceae bacterium]
MIDRKQLVQHHDPKLFEIDTSSPLSVGNGGFAFTVDVTGMQTFYDHYAQDNVPLCTMSEWGWHTTPASGKGYYTSDDLIQTEYDYDGRKVYYPVEKVEGNAHVYDWLRHNPHKFNLARIYLCIDGQEIKLSDISGISQVLNLFEGSIISCFCIKGQKITVTTVCDSETDALSFFIDFGIDSANISKHLSVKIAFPYGHHDMSGSDWQKNDSHSSYLIQQENIYVIYRAMDDIQYEVGISVVGEVLSCERHCFEIKPSDKPFHFSICFSQSKIDAILPYSDYLANATALWKNFWTNCGIIDFSKAKDKRAKELERRMVLSLYLSRIQGCGKLPPAETGLTLNSWYGRFHLEMHLWHSAYLPLYNNAHLLERSLVWYKEILPKARENAAKNGYKGARWPKQVAKEGIDSPSPIAPLLVWQQPHIIYMLELVYRQKPTQDFISEYWELVQESVNFMCDFLSYNKETNQYDLIAPLIPAQEEYDPRDVKNPTFELEYFRFGISLGIEWSKRVQQPQEKWLDIYNNIAMPKDINGVYMAHENCPNTFSKFNRDHPSMVGAFGLIPSDRINKPKMKATLDKVLECWEQETMWGWDFAMMAMTATRLGLPDMAIELLLMESPKNDYVKSGNNFQRTGNDLPLYLPGNGS